MSLAMGAFGERLRREREMRQITLDEISGSTKIARRHLEALEQEDFDALPGGIFNKGFVRAYARYVGIDEEQAVADYIAADQEQTQTEVKFPLEVHKSVALNPRRSRMPILLALLALVLILGGWSIWKRRHPQQVVNPSNTGLAASNPAASTVQPAQTMPVTNPSPSTNAAEQKTDAAAAKDNSVPTPDQAQKQTDAKPFTVVVKTNESSWISIKADGNPVAERIFDPGEEQSMSATKEITIMIGNAGGVDVSFNGTSQGVLGQKDKARTLVFTPAGLQNKPVPQTSPRLQ
jgi:cytoskeleton protein RodZ